MNLGEILWRLKANGIETSTDVEGWATVEGRHDPQTYFEEGTIRSVNPDVALINFTTGGGVFRASWADQCPHIITQRFRDLVE